MRRGQVRTDSAFFRLLAKVEGETGKMVLLAAQAKSAYAQGDLFRAYERALRLEEASERCTLHARDLPVYTGRRTAFADVEEIVCNCIGAQLGFTERGWFYLKLPMLLPKKEAGSAEYIRAALYPVFQSYFAEKPRAHMENCVLIFRHIYDSRRPQRRMRDHDNIEVNMVSDIVAMYVMKDDAPSVCSHYACSVGGMEDRTEVYVLPKKDFPIWLGMEGEEIVS